MIAGRFERVLVAMASIVGVAVLTACGADGARNDAAAGSSSPVPLGSSVTVEGSGPAFSSEDDAYEGTVTVNANPAVYVKVDGTQVIAFHVEVAPRKGKIPTDSWSLETENAVPIKQKGYSESDAATPPLGPEVSSAAKGYITFEVPRSTTPTILQLYKNLDTSGKPIAQWSVGVLPAATLYPSTSVVTTQPAR